MLQKVMRRFQALMILFVIGTLSAVAEAATFEIVSAASEARYRVKEQLMGFNFPNDAVGTTRSVRGTISFDAQGRPASGSKITVDLRTLRSDEARRDSYLRDTTLTTERFPFAEFVPLEIRGLPVPLPVSGKANVQILGSLTIRGVTRPVTWEGAAGFQGRTARLQAQTAFKFGEFELTQPRIFRVLAIEDNIRLEVDLTLRQAS